MITYKIKPGDKFGCLTAIKPAPKRHNSNYWFFQCDCHDKTIKEQSVYRVMTGRIKTCGHLKRNLGRENPKWEGYGEIPMWFFHQIKNSAIKRGIDFELTIKEIWDLFLEQDRKCIYTGKILKFAECYSKASSASASLDRINSSNIYIKGNVQWIHKDINKIKWVLPEKEFLNWCLLVVNYQK